MKKTLVASSLAIGLGVVAGNAGHDAHASETTNVDKAELAQKALTNDQSLNESPVQEGAYNINFDYNGNSYHFESDGSTWSWSYESTNNATQPVQPSQSQVATQQQPVQVSAPQNEQTAQPQTKSTSTSQTSSSKASSGSSVNVNSHLQQIAQRESGGDIHAINHLQVQQVNINSYNQLGILLLQVNIKVFHLQKLQKAYKTEQQ